MAHPHDAKSRRCHFIEELVAAQTALRQSVMIALIEARVKPLGIGL
jgi:hypothetical protein